MKNVVLNLIATLALCGCGTASNIGEPDTSKPESLPSALDYVDTRIGTAVSIADVTVTEVEEPMGYVSPIVGNPSALTHWTPQTALWTNRILTVPVPYWYDQNAIQGFRGTRYPNGAVVSDWGPISLMPMTGKVNTVAPLRASTYRHETEIAKPHYYSVHLDDYNIKAELTGASKTGFFQFTFPESDTASVVFDGVYVPGTFRVIPEANEIEGVIPIMGNMNTYFVAKFEKPFTSYSLDLSQPKIVDSALVENGFKAEYYNNMTLSGDPVAITTYESLNYDWPKSPIDGVTDDTFSARFVGVLKARYEGVHTLALTTDDGARLFVNNELVIDSWRDRGPTTDKYSLTLQKDETIDIRIEYFENGASATVKFRTSEPVTPNVNEVQALAQNGTEANAVSVTFSTLEQEAVAVKVATSLISLEQARENMAEEYGHWDFTQAVKQGEALWTQELDMIKVEGSQDDKAIFYSALTKSLVNPRNLNEGGRYFSPFDMQVHEGEMYTDLSIWDTFRSLHPLWVIIKPDETSDIINGLLNAYQEGGWIPKWPNPWYRSIMMGTHGDAIIADAYVKGIRGFDAELAFEAMLKNGYQKGDSSFAGRVGIEEFNALGYVPSDKYGESVARTLEFSYDDYAIAQMANALGKREAFDTFTQRSKRYLNVLDTELGVVRGKDSEGNWLPPYDKSVSVWARGNEHDTHAYYINHTLLVPHDIAGLASALGGNEELEAVLDELFEGNYYYVGDEFSMHAPYMYNAIGAPWKTQKVVRELLADYFFNDAGGLPGNDDCGQVSSWYVFGAMGFYPALPGDPTYQITSPVLDEVELNVGEGKVFTVVANNNSKSNIYIQSATLNGVPFNQSFIHHDTLMAGGKLVFEMGPEPNKSWGVVQK